VQLIEVDPVETEPPQAALTCCSQVRWPAVGAKLPRTLPNRAALGGDHHIVGIGMQGVGQ
jgi:hypothetical protein